MSSARFHARLQLDALALLLVGLLTLGADGAGRGDEGESANGFSLKGLRVPREEIIAGGPARDAIPSVDAPAFVPSQKATWVRPETPVIGAAIGSEARCYPIHLMEYHQVVNDRVGGVPVVISYDPLTDTAIVYRRQVDGQELAFGVSGLIYRSNFLLYDRQSESLWSQFWGRALTGRFAGTRLERVRSRSEPLAAWLVRHPESLVMTRPEPKRFDYRYSNYSSYWVSEKIPFPVGELDSRYHAKELVLGVRLADRTRAYIASILTRVGARIVDEFQGRRIRVAYDGETGTFSYEAPDDVEVTSAYWFAWRAFHPETDVWQGDLQAAPPVETEPVR